MIDPYFRPSDKFREVCRSSATYSALAIFFSLYTLPLSTFPFLALNLDAKTATETFKDINIDGLLSLIAVFYYLQMLVLYITEYIDFIRPAEFSIVEALDKLRIDYQKNPDFQRVFNSSQRRLQTIHTWNALNSYFRFTLDFILPTALFVVALVRSSKNLWIFIVNSA